MAADAALLQSIYQSLVDNVPSKDRTYHLQTYRNCFIGSEAVAFLVKSEIAKTKEEAVELGKALEAEGLLAHVTRDHPFQDADYFYRFAVFDKTRGFNAGNTNNASTPSAAEDKRLKDRIDVATGTGVERTPSEKAMIDAGADNTGVAERELDVAVTPLDEHNKKLLNLVKPEAWMNPKGITSTTLLVIGAGAGGLISAIQGGGIGLSTVIVEKHLLGGDCLNIGCVPSKALLRTAKLIRDLKECQVVNNSFGVEIAGADVVKIDFGKIMENMRRLRAEIAPADSAERYTNFGVSVFRGTAKFISRNAVEIVPSNSEINERCVIKFSKCIVATGGRAFIPPIPGLREGAVPYLTNASIFNLTTLPKVFGVIGSGPIGTEMAQAFACFGSQVHVFDMQDKILPREDREAAEMVQKSMESDGVLFHLKTSIKRVEPVEKGGKMKIVFETDGGGEQELVLDELLVSAGRAPNVEGLGLETAGVKYTARGIKVQDGLQTTNSNIYAVGDVCLKYQFTHMADASAKVAFRNAMFPVTNEKISKLIIPWCTYTMPEIAHVGAYEHELAADGIKFQSFKTEFDDNDRARLDRHAEGFVKLFVGDRGKILGCTIVGSNAGELISQVTIAMKNKVSAVELNSHIVPYPTVSDAIKRVCGEVNKQRLKPSTKALLRNIVALKQLAA